MKERFEELYEMMKLDRAKSSWSKQQTFDGFCEQLKSEVDEVKEAIDNENWENLKEELGDTLGDLLFLFAMLEEKGKFTAKEIIEGYIEKFKKRKSWIFKGEELSVEEEMKRWLEAKKKEKSI